MNEYNLDNNTDITNLADYNNINNNNLTDNNLIDNNVNNLRIENNININQLTNKINDLYDDAFKSVYQIIKNNNEKIITTKNYYLINLDNVSQKTLKELNDFIIYLDTSYLHLTNDEVEKNKLKIELSKIN